jgi:nucleotide-binding universal stress UspA family protein
MKIKPAYSKRGVAIELSATESQIPAPPSAFSLKKILVPVDFSTLSKKGVDYAVALAKQFGSEVTLFHVTQSCVPVADIVGPETTDLLQRIHEAAETSLAKWHAELDRGVASKTVLRFGEPCMEIVRAAKELSIDLIVISTHGRIGLAHTFLGSTAERVIRHAPCPVLVVREREHEFLAESRH